MTDDLLVAVSIFLLYESLDNRQLEILQHMTGAHDLLQIDILHQTCHPAPERGIIDTTEAWRASFWNFACVDYVVSFTEQTPTQLDTANPRIWKAAGLPIREVDGVYVPDALCSSDGDGSLEQMTETVACRTLIWIVLETLNFIAADKDRLQRRTGARLKYWHHMRQLLEDWYTAFPDTFEPYMKVSQPQSCPWIDEHVNYPDSTVPTASASIVSRSRSEIAPTTTQIPFFEQFYSSPMSSTTILLYHFAQILLLLHQPLNNPDSHSRFITTQLAAYRQAATQIDVHAREICAIALGRPDPAVVRMHMLQPLYLAGLCLDGHEQRVVLAGLLAGIQRDTGCETEWRVMQLREEWGWEDAAVHEF